MTIGIGLLCDSGKCLLMGADKRGTYEPIATANDECGKLFDLPFGFCAAVAGTIAYCEAVISELYHRMDALKENERSVEYIKAALAASLQHTHLGLVETALMQNCGITLSQYWRDKRLATKVRDNAEGVVKAASLPVQSIIGGFRGDSPILLWSNALEILEEASPGIALIGSGTVAALHWLGYRHQNVSMSVQRSYMHLVEAKQFAEIVTTVGPVAQYVMLTKHGMKPLEGQDSLVQRWWETYGLKNTDRLDSIESRNEFRQAFGISEQQ